MLVAGGIAVLEANVETGKDTGAGHVETQKLFSAWNSNRDRKALERLIALELPLVFRIASRFLGNSHDAEDVAQTVLLQLCQTPSGSVHDLKRWLYAATMHAAHNFARDVNRRQRREKERRMNNENVVAKGPVGNNEEKREVHAALHSALVRA